MWHCSLTTWQFSSVKIQITQVSQPVWHSLPVKQPAVPLEASTVSGVGCQVCGLGRGVCRKVARATYLARSGTCSCCRHPGGHASGDTAQRACIPLLTILDQQHLLPPSLSLLYTHAHKRTDTCACVRTHTNIHSLKFVNGTFYFTNSKKITLCEFDICKLQSPTGRSTGTNTLRINHT